MRVSWLTGWPSARTEIQEVSSARMTSVRGAVAVSDDFGFGLAKERTVTSFLSLFTPPFIWLFVSLVFVCFGFVLFMPAFRAAAATGALAVAAGCGADGGGEFGAEERAGLGIETGTGGLACA